MTETIKGRLLADQINEKTKNRLNKFEQPLGLAAILVGDNPASNLYVNLKERAAKKVGIYFEKIIFPADAKEKTIIQTINELNKREDIQGILVQLPLPTQDETKIVSTINPLKDVDGFHKENLNLLKERKPGLVSPVALAIMRLIQATNQPLSGKSAVIIGNNEIFAQPIIELASEQNIQATFIKKDEGSLPAKTRIADIIIVAVGELDFLKKDMVKEGAIVIDVGTNKRDGKPTGDSAPDVQEHASFMSPVPGGVGPLTVAYLLTNVIKAKILQNENKK